MYGEENRYNRYYKGGGNHNKNTYSYNPMKPLVGHAVEITKLLVNKSELPMNGDQILDFYEKAYNRMNKISEDINNYHDSFKR
jgi:hypothetical protein